MNNGKYVDVNGQEKSFTYGGVLPLSKQVNFIIEVAGMVVSDELGYMPILKNIYFLGPKYLILEVGQEEIVNTLKGYDVTALDASEARNTAGPINSSGSNQRPAGVLAQIKLSKG